MIYISECVKSVRRCKHLDFICGVHTQGAGNILYACTPGTGSFLSTLYKKELDPCYVQGAMLEEFSPTVQNYGPTNLKAYRALGSAPKTH